VQKFITCEGRFSIAHLYQMRLLTHISGDDPLNLPHYFYNSLLKMAKRYQKQPLSSPQYVYHSGLIKILVQFQLNKKGKSWDEFLLVGGFQGCPPRRKWVARCLRGELIYMWRSRGMCHPLILIIRKMSHHLILIIKMKQSRKALCRNLLL
jgi:hypothetical protein